MDISPAAWIAIPLLGGVIGYVTNRIAVTMIFRPVEPVNVLGLRVQGLIGRRQQDLAESIGRVVGSHLLSHEDIAKAFARLDFEAVIGDVLGNALEPKIAELRQMPLIGGFLTDERIGDLKASVARGIARDKDLLLAKIEAAIEDGLDVQAIVTEKVAAFPVPRLEELVLEVANRELRAIELLGGVLGLLIGLLQVALLVLLG